MFKSLKSIPKTFGSSKIFRNLQEMRALSNLTMVNLQSPKLSQEPSAAQLSHTPGPQRQSSENSVSSVSSWIPWIFNDEISTLISLRWVSWFLIHETGNCRVDILRNPFRSCTFSILINSNWAVQEGSKKSKEQTRVRVSC